MSIEFDPALFREQFPQFSDDVKYPDAFLQMYWDMATCYISDSDYGFLSGDCRVLAINLMTAHLVLISALNAGDGTPTDPGVVTSSSVDKVSISIQPPPNQDQWSWWLSKTPYGQQLEALLSANIVGGYTIGGLPEKSAFRRVGGFFY